MVAQTQRAHAPVIRHQITDRDACALRWIGRHGFVSLDQLVKKYYWHSDDSHPSTRIYSRWMGYRRTEIMIAHRLLVRSRPDSSQPPVLALTPAGARFADLGVRAVVPNAWAVAHSLALVSASEYLLATNPTATYQTEREFRADHYRSWRAQKRRPEVSRFTDGVLVYRNGRREAVEVDLAQGYQRGQRCGQAL